MLEAEGAAVARNGTKRIAAESGTLPILFNIHKKGRIIAGMIISRSATINGRRG